MRTTTSNPDTETQSLTALLIGHRRTIAAYQIWRNMVSNRRERRTASDTKPSLWERWWMRTSVLAAVVATVLTLAMAGDHDAESWPAKTAEFLGQLFTQVFNHN